MENDSSSTPLKTLSKNTLVIMAGQLISRLLSFVLIVFIAKYLGDVGLGRYSFALSFCGLFVVFSELGLRELMIREVARHKEKAKKYLSNVILIKFFLSVGVVGLIFVVINGMAYPEETTFIVYVIGLSVVLNSFARLINSLFNAYEKMEFESATVILERIVACGFGILMLILGYGLREVALALLAGSVLNVLVSFFLTVKKIVKPTIETDWKFWTKLIKAAFPFGLVYIFVIIYFQVDTVMLSVMKGDAPVGWYNAAYKIIFALQIFPVALVNALFPIISRYYVSSKDTLKVAFEKALKYLILIGFPIAVGVTILAEKIILLIYGEGFIPSIITLRILIWVAALMFITYLFGNVLGSIDRQLVIAKVSGINAVVNIVLNFILIPRYSYIGAAIATLATEAIGFTLYFLFIAKHLQKVPLPRYLWRPVISGMLMGLFLYFFKNTNLFVLVTLATVLYFVILQLLGAFPREDWNLFKRIIRGNAEM